MTDKQIIIDDQKKTIHRLQDECTEKTNAIIALGEQLDQLKFDYAELEKRHNDSFEQFKQLKAENDELKKQLTILDGEDVVVEITVKQFEEYKKLKQTLTEIKEIVFPKNQLIITDSPIILKIQEKISECEVE